MKLFTALAALTLIAAPVQAESFTGRFYGPSGSYTKCTTYLSGSSGSTFCKSGEEARDEDRRLGKKNTCMGNLKEQHLSKWGDVGLFDSAQYAKWDESYKANDVAYSEYAAKRQACFSSNGFN